MDKRAAKLWLVQGVTLARVGGALVFACIAFQRIPVVAIASCYSIAIVSDLLDGFLARRLRAETYLGKVLDLVGDKALTIVSLLYAAERGISFAPLALIGVREIAMTGLRLVRVQGTQLFPTNRAFGGTIATIMWSATLLLVASRRGAEPITIATALFWACAVALCVNFGFRVYTSRVRVIASLADARPQDPRP